MIVFLSVVVRRIILVKGLRSLVVIFLVIVDMGLRNGVIIIIIMRL